MKTFKAKDMRKLSEKEIADKIKELGMDLMKERVNATKGGKIKIREIKKTIARLYTVDKLNKISKVKK